MLSVSQYEISYVESAHAQIFAQLKDFEGLHLPPGGQFERGFLNHLAVALDHYFNHRARALEGKDGNALNEVRMIANSVMENAGILRADKTIKYVVGRSVSGVGIGEPVVLTTESFRRLAEAFFAKIVDAYR